MRIVHADELRKADELFRVLETTDRAQVAVMVLGEGEVSGEFGTDHPQADQILFVMEGGGSLRVEDEEAELHTGDVAVIPAGKRHQVRGPNRTLHVYAPVAYPDEE
jgi:mannose-6-phosphate isomerase-like protein (cupin superfamily)